MKYKMFYNCKLLIFTTADQLNEWDAHILELFVMILQLALVASVPLLLMTPIRTAAGPKSILHLRTG